MLSYSNTFTNFIAKRIYPGSPWFGTGIMFIKSHMPCEKLDPSGGRIYLGSALYIEVLQVAPWGMDRRFYFGMIYGLIEFYRWISHICFLSLRMIRPQSNSPCHKRTWIQFFTCLCHSKHTMSSWTCRFGFRTSPMTL